MPDDRLSRLRKGYAEDDCLGLEPPDLGPIRALAETAEFAEAEARLADAYGRPLPADDPLAPLARDIARALTEAGFALHHCAQSHPRYRLGGVCLVPVARGHDPSSFGWRGIRQPEQRRQRFVFALCAYVDASARCVVSHHTPGTVQGLLRTLRLLRIMRLEG